MTEYRRKLIEASPFLPLDAVSAASIADKNKKVGTTKNIHKWFAPMPTPALRAMIFAALVDVPDQPAKHQELLRLIEDLVPADGGSPSDEALRQARRILSESSAAAPPTIFDPFCGGGSTLIEAQRLGLTALGSDLNPVPVLISRTITELIPSVAGRPPLVAETTQERLSGPTEYDGLLGDLEYYADYIRSRVLSEVGHLYPKLNSTSVPVAWLWSHTTTCQNPACGATLPLVTSGWLRKGQSPKALVGVPQETDVAFEIGATPSPDNGTVSRSAAHCVVCGSDTPLSAVRQLAGKNGLGRQLLCIVADGPDGRTYLPPTTEEIPPTTTELLRVALPDKALGFRVQAYGMRYQRDMYTERQLATLGAFAMEISQLPATIREDGGDELYAKTIVSVLGLALGKLAQSNSTQVRWNARASGSSKAEPAFGRHALPMVWDYAETNPFGGSVGDWMVQIRTMAAGIRSLPRGVKPARVFQSDARTAGNNLEGRVVVVTDPPYFDQIGYADLSDYFYVWHRMALQTIHPDLYETIVTPKEPELIASPHRHGGDMADATSSFVSGFSTTFASLARVMNPDYPMLIVYAHRQEQRSGLGSASTGWDAMLGAIVDAGLAIESTLPVRGAVASRQIGHGKNALATYMVLACRPRSRDARPGSIREFRGELRQRLPTTLRELLRSGESMIDVRQAAIGPGMEVFTGFSSVFDGHDPIPVRQALSIINDELGMLLDEQLGTVDDATRWACRWYEAHAFEPGKYEEALSLAQVYGFGIDQLESLQIVEKGSGTVRLAPRSAMLLDGDDTEHPVWVLANALVHSLVESPTAGERQAAETLATTKDTPNGVGELARYLTNTAIVRGWSDDAVAYDSLVQSWPRIVELSSTSPDTRQLPLEGYA